METRPVDPIEKSCWSAAEKQQKIKKSFCILYYKNMRPTFGSVLIRTARSQRQVGTRLCSLAFRSFNCLFSTTSKGRLEELDLEKFYYIGDRKVKREVWNLDDMDYSVNVAKLAEEGMCLIVFASVLVFFSDLCSVCRHSFLCVFCREDEQNLDPKHSRTATANCVRSNSSRRCQQHGHCQRTGLAGRVTRTKT